VSNEHLIEWSNFVLSGRCSIFFPNNKHSKFEKGGEDIYYWKKWYQWCIISRLCNELSSLHKKVFLVYGTIFVKFGYTSSSSLSSKRSYSWQPVIQSHPSIAGKTQPSFSASSWLSEYPTSNVGAFDTQANNQLLILIILVLISCQFYENMNTEKLPVVWEYEHIL
jgi:hypothetical protein